MHPYKGQSSADSSAKLSRILGDTPKAYAGGGRVKGGGKKAATHINIMVAPQAQDQMAKPPMPMPPPMPPMGAPPPAMSAPVPPPKPMPAPMPAGAMGMPAANAMPMRAKGGRVYDEGVRNGTQVQHSDGKNDGKWISTKPPITKARGGKVTMKAGAGSGLGRLENQAAQKKVYP